jgi:hypothetical protein
MFGSPPNGDLKFDGHQVYYMNGEAVYEDFEFRLDPNEWRRWKTFALEGMKKYRDYLRDVEVTVSEFRITDPDGYDYLELSYIKPLVRVTRRHRI